MLRSLRACLLPCFVALAAQGCTDKPKVARAGVGEPTPVPSATRQNTGADSVKNTTPPSSSPGGFTQPAAVASSKPDEKTGSKPAEKSPDKTDDKSKASVPAPTETADSGGASRGGMQGESASGLHVPDSLSSAQQESAQHKAACESGDAIGCMRLASYLKGTGKRDDARRAYAKACVRGGTPTPDACKPGQVPKESDARGCYEASLMASFDGDQAGARSLLQCACQKSFQLACDDAGAKAR